MERKRKGRRKAVYGRQRKQKKEGCSGMLLLILLLILLFFLLGTEKASLKQMAAKAEAFAAEMLRTEQAVEALGHSFANRPEEGESAIVVFGRMILGIEDNREENTANEPIVQCIDEAREHIPEEIAESAEPLLDPSQLAENLAAEENDDSTINQVFRIPSPDIVDDTVYTPAISMCMPLENYRVTSRFGYRIHPISGNTTFHYGADLAAVTGTKVCSVADGTVSETGYGSINGNYIKIAHADGYVSHYTHLHSIHVKKGEKVGMGEYIGTVGSTGYSTGPHLHFELRRNGSVLDPFAYFAF